MKAGEEEEDLISYIITTIFVEQPLATPGSANYHMPTDSFLWVGLESHNGANLLTQTNLLFRQLWVGTKIIMLQFLYVLE